MEHLRRIIRETIKDLLRENFNKNLKEAKPNRYVYHKSVPIFRDKISKEGLIPQRGDQWLSDTKIDGKAIFVTNSDNPEDWFDSDYDDDVYKIDTSKITNKWFFDPNFEEGIYKTDDNDSLITLEKIPLEAIELIHKGTGESLY
jgi:hypothetical protein